MPKTVRLPIKIALAYIRRESIPPARLTALIQQYRDLEFFIDEPAVAERQDAIWERILAAITVTRTVNPEKQLRRIEKRKYARMSLQQKWDNAIDQWRKGARV